MDEEQLTQEMEEEQFEEEDTIQQMEEEPNTLGEHPLISGHLPFGEMEITLAPKNKVMDVCSVTFNQLKEKDPQNLVSVSTEKVVTANTRRDLREAIMTNVAFTTLTHDNFEYLLTVNARLKK